MSRGTKARSNRRAREADQRFGPDRAVVVYEFENGWTIRRANCVSDLYREGWQMLSCLRNEPESDDPFPLETVYSLRDPDNAPHLTIRHVEDFGMIAYGKGESIPKPEYMPYIREWAATLPDGNDLFDAAAGPSKAQRNDPGYLVRAYVLTVSEAHDEAFVDYLERGGRHDDAAYLRIGDADADPAYLSDLLGQFSTGGGR